MHGLRQQRFVSSVDTVISQHLQTRSGKYNFLGLPRKDFTFFAPFLRPRFPSIAYPCWDHSSRTSVRNLMNSNISIVAGILPSGEDKVQRYSVASIHDLLTLKLRHPNAAVRHADITPHIKQNCDATVRVISALTIQQLGTHVPESQGTQLYLKASLWVHEPFRNTKFGSPAQVVQSLWAGVMTWRWWRRFIQLSETLTLTNHFISRAHYMTLELMVHAGILHQLAMFLCFPNLDSTAYSLRNTGNRSIEAVHGIFRGGSHTCPSPLPTFCLPNSSVV